MDKTMTLGSLFSGSGGFELGGTICGIKPIWNSEVEPFAIAVTKKRFPNVLHLGDINKINGATVPPVDIITGGFCCQDLSVAGKRAGLHGDRSGLFFQIVRIIKEMRAATDNSYPKFAVLENVPGMYSSNKGLDFLEVLNELIKIKNETLSVHMPENGKWLGAGEILGDHFSLAYRTIDAQFWGVAQRRRRCYIVVDFTGERAGEILFDESRLSGNPAASGAQGQGTAGGSAGCAGNTGIAVLNDQGGARMSISEDIAGTLRAQEHGHAPCVIQASGFCTEHSAQSRGVGYEKEKSPTLRAGVVPGVAIQNHPADSRVKLSEDGIVQTLSSRMGTGGNNTPLAMVYGICSQASNAMQSPNPRSGFYEADTAKTLDTGANNPSRNQGGIAVCVQGSVIGREEKNGPQGSGVNEETAFTLNTADRHAVAYAMTTGSFGEVHEEQAATLMARDYKDPHTTFVPQVVNQSQYLVRRLTPTECALLQGFPSDWCADLGLSEPTEDDIAFWTNVFATHADINDKKPKTRNQIVKWLRNPHTDSAEYKLWGNGCCLNNVVFVLGGIVYYTQASAPEKP